MSGIRVSEKHGVNPTISTCFWCGKDKNEIALLGKYTKDDAQAPMHMVLDYEPCDECKKNMDLGVTIVCVTTSPISQGQPPFQKGAYPTGQFIVMKEEAFREWITDDAVREAGLKHRKMLMLKQDFDAVFTQQN